MEFLEEYVRKCVSEKKYLIKTSMLAGLIIGFILLIIDIIAGRDIKTSVVSFVIISIIFFFMWLLIVRQLNKLLEKQDRRVKEEVEINRNAKRANLRRKMKNNKK